jgi:biopolymer transport protein ExbD
MAALVLRVGRRHAPNSQPNVIPFIDVLLVLLIIFMVTAPKPTTDLRVDLPRPGSSQPPLIPPTIVDVRDTADGFAIFIDADSVPIADLGPRTLAHILARNDELTPRAAYAEARVYVRADLDVAYQHVVRVVETLQLARFRKVAILAQRADDG